MDTNTLLSVRDLRVRFRNEGGVWTETLKGVSFDVPAGATVALVGESGSGKSVSALAVMGLLPPQTSRIAQGASLRFEGRELLGQSTRERRQLCGKDIAMVFQEPMSSLNPVFTVGFQIAEVLRQHLGLNGAAARQRVLALLQEVGIPEPERRIDSYPNQLSGGQQQRVMIAMAIACAPKLLIADEPTTALDVTVQRQIVELIARLQRERGMAVLFITHDLGLVADIADQVVVMRHGEVREAGPAQAVLHAPRDPYTRALLACRPPLDARPRRLPVIETLLAGAPAPEPERVRGSDPGATPLLAVEGLSIHYKRPGRWWRSSEFAAVQDVSFRLERGKTLGIVGESGSGKTTVGLSLLRLQAASSGRVLFDGQDLLSLPAPAFRPYKRRLQIVFQNPYASLNPRFTVGQILLEPMRLHAIGANDEERVALAAQLLQRVGLPADAARRYPHQFSGGQRQRIAIARCLGMRPEVLVCDESVSALDVSVQAQVLNLLQDLQDELGLSYLFISHDLAVVKYMADSVMVMQQGRVVETADSDVLYRHPQHPYTRSLLAAIPRVA